MDFFKRTIIHGQLKGYPNKKILLLDQKLPYKYSTSQVLANIATDSKANFRFYCDVDDHSVFHINLAPINKQKRLFISKYDSLYIFLDTDFVIKRLLISGEGSRNTLFRDSLRARFPKLDDNFSIPLTEFTKKIKERKRKQVCYRDSYFKNNLDDFPANLIKYEIDLEYLINHITWLEARQKDTSQSHIIDSTMQRVLENLSYRGKSYVALEQYPSYIYRIYKILTHHISPIDSVSNLDKKWEIITKNLENESLDIALAFWFDEGMHIKMGYERVQYLNDKLQQFKQIKSSQRHYDYVRKTLLNISRFQAEQPAPNFYGKDLKGYIYTLNMYKEIPIAIQFLDINDIPDINNVLKFDTLQNKYQSNSFKFFTFVYGSANKKEIQQFAEKYLKNPDVIDFTGSTQQIVKDYLMFSSPKYVLINKGIIQDPEAPLPVTKDFELLLKQLIQK